MYCSPYYCTAISTKWSQFRIIIKADCDIKQIFLGLYMHTRTGWLIWIIRVSITHAYELTLVLRYARFAYFEDEGWIQLQLIYRAVVIAKLTYASSSWWGFTSASDRQRLEGFLRRGRRYGLYPADQPTRRARRSGSYTVTTSRHLLSSLRMLTIPFSAK